MFAIAPRLRTDMTDLIQVSPSISVEVRNALASASFVELNERRQRTIDLFRRVVDGELD